MSSYMEVMRVDDLEEAQMRCVGIQGQELVVARAGGRFYVTDNRCPHLASKLAQGELNGTVVTCPGHGSQFDLSDGSVVRWTHWTGLKLELGKLLKPPASVKTYPVKVEGGRVLVEL
ncbi:MAG: Rieske (2Fe-2S) protein [Chloroflexota bacterium]